MSIENVIEEAQSLILSGKPDEALEMLSGLGEEGANNAAVRNKSGVCLVMLGRIVEAEAEFRASTALDGRFAQAYSNLGNIHKEKGELVRAEELYRKAIQEDPTYPNSYHNLGVFYNNQGRYDKGIPLLKTAKQLELGKGDIRRGKRKQAAWRYSWVAVAFLIGAAFILLRKLK